MLTATFTFCTARMFQVEGLRVFKAFGVLCRSNIGTCSICVNLLSPPL